MVFDEGDGCQLLAELLQHDHPLQQSHVVDTKREKSRSKATSTTLNPQDKGAGPCRSTHLMPSGSRPNNLFLTSSSLGVKSGMR